MGLPGNFVRRLPTFGLETLVALASLFLAATANTAFWRGALAGRSIDDVHTWIFAAATLVLLASLHFLIITAIANLRTIRPVLGVIVVVSLLADHYMSRYGIVLDASMLRNVLSTDVREASELISFGAVATLAAGLAAAFVIWNLRLRPRSLLTAVRRRAAAMAAAFVALVASLILVFQDFGSLMRNQHALRYTINPASLVWSLASIAVADARSINQQRDPPEPVKRLRLVSAGKPKLLVMVVGETARAANFGLNGYERPTTPELSRLNIINFPHAQACGTSTDVSVPCLFSPFGRADYDESRIRRHESLLHVLSRAGYRVVWLDNQSGCKGVCDALEAHDVSRSTASGLCANGRCLDEILSQELQRVVSAASGDTVVVLHQIGNHGPAYFRRYPSSSKRFEPACEHEDLRSCSRQEIVNAYDNAIAYTDHFLAGLVQQLDGWRSRFDAAMVYVSDHGESLGEKGLYLHGIPYAIAPNEQLHVPMLWWLPSTTAKAMGFDEACFRANAGSAVSHDNIYHTVMGMLGVSTPRYRAERDLSAACRRHSA